VERQYSGETQNIYIIVTNLFKTLCIKFYHNRQSFIEYMTKILWLTFYYNTTVL